MKWILKRQPACQGLQSGAINCNKIWICDSLEYDSEPVAGFLCGDLYFHLSAGVYYLKNEMNVLRGEKLPALYDNNNNIVSWLVYNNTFVYKNIRLRELNDWVTIGRQTGLNELDNQKNAIVRIMHEIDKVYYRNELLELEIV